MNTWSKSFTDLFRKIDASLGSVLPATGCREGWLQAETFRHFRREGVAFYTNYLSLPGTNGLKNRKADFAAYESEIDDARLTLVAELKVYGEKGFYPKVLTGGSLQEVRRRALRGDGSVTFNNCAADRQLVLGPGLLADYFRLVDFAASGPLTRMLVLCVRKADTPDELGRILQRVEFEQPGVMLRESKSFWAKSWIVGADA